jgi:hypothetical protein
MTETKLKVVLLAGLLASVLAAAGARRWLGGEFAWLFWLIWPAMLLHQCEENVFSEFVLGKEFRFLRWVRTVGYDLTPTRAFMLNVLVGWTLAILSGVVGESFVAFPLFVAAVESVNGFWHLSVTALQRRWSPGTLTGTLVAIPLGFWLLHASITAGLISPWACLAIFVLAALSHHCFLASLPRATSENR